MSKSSSSISIYRLGGSLPVNAPSYVKRQADEDLYRLLKEGEYCYVLNSRQMGKSSLRVQTKVRLEAEGVACAVVDLSTIGIDITAEKWYAGVIDKLVGSFKLYETFDLKAWWTRQGLLSPTQKLGKFLAEILLKKIRNKVVVFIDEIDKTFKLPFKKDDFFALIRACYNQRADDQDYERLTFCLLGVAAPTDLIEDKQSTPFNIGSGVELTGFELQEVEPLTRGLQEKVDNPAQVMEDILFWTGGQPFLTQRLCNLVVRQESRSPNLSELVQHDVVDHWEAQDDQVHLTTIKKRLLSNEQPGYLLELYRQVLKEQEIDASESSEERQLQLSGLVVKKGSKLKVYNPIYEKVFDEDWIDAELDQLSPYAYYFREWKASGREEKYLLSEKLLKDAEKWAKGKNLSGEDKDFLAASHIKQDKLQREIERRKEAERAKQYLEKVNRQAHRQIRIGNIVLGLAFLVATVFGIMAGRAQQQLQQANAKLQGIEKYIAPVEKLEELAEKLPDSEKKKEIDTLVEQSQKIEDFTTTVAFRQVIKALAYLYLEDFQKSKDSIEVSLSFVHPLMTENSAEALPIFILLKKTEGSWWEKQKNYPEAIKAYTKVFEMLESGQYDPSKYPLKIMTEDQIKSFHYLLLRLLEKSQTEDNLKGRVEASLKSLYVDRKNQYIKELEDLLKQNNWQKADDITWSAILASGYSQDVDKFLYSNVSCTELRKIDELWYSYSDGQFGFRVQMEIYRQPRNPIPIGYYKPDAYQAFGDAVGWRKGREWKSNWDLRTGEISLQISPKGYLPIHRLRDITSTYGFPDLELERGIRELELFHCPYSVIPFASLCVWGGQGGPLLGQLEKCNIHM